MTQEQAKQTLKAVGVSFKRLADTGEFLVGSTYYTDDLQDAVDTGLAQARAQASQPRPMVAVSCDSQVLDITWDNGLSGQWQLTNDDGLAQVHHSRYQAQALNDD